jgi:NADH:ubiquinone oxidoreductase subunit 5 (subunit L)/multisubunit Na+/H+ antiporter MnhA subunit
VLGFTGAVLHSLNHALFKSLLFLGAGAVVRATGTRTIDALGGVGRRMPLTAAAFLLASVAIVGLPPLNGFVSEWILLQALLHGGMAQGPTQSMVFAAAGLGLISALAVACFTRVSGAVFLGNPRTATHAEWKEVGPGMLVPMLALGSACVILGVVPLIALRPAARVVGQLLASSAVVPGAGGPEVPPAALALGTLAAALGAAVAGVAGVRSVLARRIAPALAATWGCAYPRPSARMQYTASSFGAPLLAAFGSLVKPREVVAPDAFATIPDDPVLSRVAGPVWARVRTAAAALRPLQQGRVTTYLQYIVVTLLVLLGVLFVSVRRP